MMTRASFSGSWCDETRVETTSARMKCTGLREARARSKFTRETPASRADGGGGAQRYVAERARHDLASDRQDASRLPDCVLEVARDLRHRRDEQVAEGMAAQRTIAPEAMLKELGHERFRLGKRGEALADVTR